LGRSLPFRGWVTTTLFEKRRTKIPPHSREELIHLVERQHSQPLGRIGEYTSKMMGESSEKKKKKGRHNSRLQQRRVTR